MRLMMWLGGGAAVVVLVALASCSPASLRSGGEGQARAREEGGAGRRGASADGSRGGWSEVAPGVELKRLAWDEGGVRSPVVALRVAPERLAVAAGGGEADARGWRARGRALAAFNGGFFDAEGRSLGVRLSEGRLLSRPHGSRWSVFRIKSIGSKSIGSGGRSGGRGRVEAGIVSARDFADALKRGVRYTQAVQCGPLLASGGRVGSFKKQWDRRTGLGIDSAGRVVVAACDGDLSLRAWAECFVRGLGCPDALNLDGGSSTQVSLRAGEASVEWSGGRTVPDAILVR